MPISNFTTSRSLTATEINNVVKDYSIGVYVLGYVNTARNFIVEYVGRSDTDLNSRLKDHAYIGKYKRFKFIYCTTVKDAHKLECKLYHYYKKQIDNEMHPDSPNGKNYDCLFAKF